MINCKMRIITLLNVNFLVHNNIRGDKMIDYSPLWKTMEEKNITQYFLMKKGNIDNKTIYNLKRNKGITMSTL